jgi:hypothetical protein
MPSWWSSKRNQKNPYLIDTTGDNTFQGEDDYKYILLDHRIKIAKAIAKFTPKQIEKFVTKLLKNEDTKNIMSIYTYNYLCLKHFKHTKRDGSYFDANGPLLYNYKINLRYICTLLMNDETIDDGSEDYKHFKKLLDYIDKPIHAFAKICLDVEYNDKDFQMDEEEENDNIPPGGLDFPQFNTNKGYSSFNLIASNIRKELNDIL